MHDNLKNKINNLLSENVLRTTLPNGLTVIFKENTSVGLVSAQLYVKTGSIYEAPYLGTGISHYVEHMLFKGTKRRSYQDISQHIHAAGGSINAYTTFDRTVYYIDTLSESIDIALDTLSDIAFCSIFSDSETKQEKEVILREIDMGLDDPDQQIGQAVFSNAYRVHPYRYPVIGIKEAFLELDRNTIYDYYKERYVPNNMVLVLVGNINEEQALKKIQNYFGHIPYQRQSSLLLPTEPSQIASRKIKLYGDYKIARGSLAFKIPHLSHPDAPGLDILANILGQGQSSFLFQKIRQEKELVYHIDAQAWKPGQEGLLWISYICQDKNLQSAQEAILEELEVFKTTPCTQESIHKSVRQAFVSEIDSQKKISGQATRLGKAEVVLGDLGYPKFYLEQLSTVSTDTIQMLAKKYISTSTLTQVSLEPKHIKPVHSIQQSYSFSLPNFQTTYLSNGVTLSLQSTPKSSKINIRVMLMGGALYETEEQSGITALLSTLLTKDTQKRNELEVAQAIESIGGNFYEFTGNNTFGLNLEVLPDDIALALDILDQALFYPNIQSKNFNIERDNQIAQLKSQEDDIFDHGLSLLRNCFFENHPYRFNALGKVDSLCNLQPSMLLDHLRKLLVGSNVIVTVSGDFEDILLFNDLKNIFEKVPAGKVIPHSVDFKKSCSLKKEIQVNKEQSLVLIAYPDCGARSKDYIIGTLLNEVFSGLSSDLFTKIREQKGLAYYVGASRITGLQTGMFYFYAGTQAKHSETVLKDILSEVYRIKNGGITSAELQRCKTRLKAQKRTYLQTPQARANEAAIDIAYGYCANTFQKYDALIEAITSQEIQKFAQTYFNNDQEIQLILSPSN